MSTASDLMELREELIREKYKLSEAMLDGFDHTPRIAKPRDVEAPKPRSSGIGTRRRFRSTTPGLVTKPTARAERVQLAARIGNLHDDDPLTTPLQATALQALRRALSAAQAVTDQFARQTGLTDMMRDNLQGALDKARHVEFDELLSAASLISLHVFANMTDFLLSAASSGTEDEEMELGEVEEIVLDNPQLALHGALWELDQEMGLRAKTDTQLIRVIRAYCEQLMDKVALRAAASTRLKPFTDIKTRIEADDFEINGFSATARLRASTLTMSFKKPNEVIGNHIAKYQAMKLAKMIMAYDFSRKLNPFAELGGFIFTFMGDGQPGTGKTTLIRMMAGLINDYCQNAGYPFRYENLSTESIDSYQGKSAQNAKAFFRNVSDPKVIGFGTIDDIDQLAGKRGDRQSSAGQLEITAVLMESFSGANTVVRGNCTFGMFSNYPENVDDALRQRAGARFLVNGPQSREDYIDILHLLMGKNHDIPLGDHKLYENQVIKKAVAASYESHSRPHEEGLISVFERVHDRIGDLDTIAKLGTYLKAIQQADSRFTGRAIKNITDAVKVRAMDFELPDEWMENTELFLAQDYETKLNMIAELTRPITVEMVIQEINRYADSEFRYADKSDDAAIADMVRDMRRMAEAKRRYGDEIGNG